MELFGCRTRARAYRKKRSGAFSTPSIGWIATATDLVAEPVWVFQSRAAPWSCTRATFTRGMQPQASLWKWRFRLQPAMVFCHDAVEALASNCRVSGAHCGLFARGAFRCVPG